MAVIAVLVAVAIPTFGNQLEKSRQAADVANMRSAYAAAKLEVLNQSEKDESILYGYRYSRAEDILCWWNVDKSTFSAVDGATTTVPSDYVVGRASATKVVIDTKALPDTLVYQDATLAAEDTGTQIPGTTTKGIVVYFKYNADTTLYSLETITFSEKAELTAKDLTVKVDNAGTLEDYTPDTSSVKLANTNTTLNDVDLTKAITATGAGNNLAFVDDESNTLKATAAAYSISEDDVNLGYKVTKGKLSAELKTALSTGTKVVKVTVTIVEGLNVYTGTYDVTVNPYSA